MDWLLNRLKLLSIKRMDVTKFVVDVYAELVHELWSCGGLCAKIYNFNICCICWYYLVNCLLITNTNNI
jgi:hypothetical protein